MVLTAVSSKTTFHYNNELVTPKYSLSTLQKNDFSKLFQNHKFSNLNFDKWKNWIKVKFYKIQVLEHHKDLKIKLCGLKLDRTITKLDLGNFILQIKIQTWILLFQYNRYSNVDVTKIVLLHNCKWLQRLYL